MKKAIAISTLLALGALGMACGGEAPMANNTANKANNAAPANTTPANTAPSNAAPSNAAPSNAAPSNAAPTTSSNAKPAGNTTSSNAAPEKK